MSWVALGSAAITAGGAMGSAALSKKGEKGYSTAVDPYKKVREPLVDWLGKSVGKPGPSYKGNFVAPMSEQEKGSFDFLRKYGESGYSKPFQQAKGEIDKTFSGQYDPSKSPYYQAVKAQASKNLAQTKKDISSDSAGAGRFWSGARLSEQADAGIDVNQALDKLLGQMSERERERRLDIIPQAIQMGEMEQQLPLQQATAYQALGALPRNIQQALDSAKYSDWMQSQVEYPLRMGSLASNVQTPPTYQAPQPSFMSQMAPGLGQGLGEALPGMLKGLFNKNKAVAGKGGYGSNTPSGVRNMGTWSKF